MVDFKRKLTELRESRMASTPSNPVTDLFGDTQENSTKGSIDLDAIFPPGEEEGSDIEGFMDGLRSKKLTEEELAEREQSLFIPTGMYRWKGKPTLKPWWDQNDRDAKYFSQRGRSLISISGIVTQVNTPPGQKAREGFFVFQLSPDYKAAPNGQPDFATQNYAKLSSFFLKREARRHSDEPELIYFLAKGDYAMQISLNAKTSRNNLQEFQL
jgi:hypothetical protein